MDQVYSFIQERTGLALNEHQRSDIASLVTKKSQHDTSFNSDVWLQTLDNASINSPAWQEIIDLVTVNETYFFRNRDQFTALREVVLPSIIGMRRAAQQKSLRIWCAGCATGEEPYSLAILLRDLLPDYKDWQITLLATDINLNSLERAKQGVFRPWSFRNETPSDIQKRWFKAEKERYVLNPSIKKMVTFSQLNLMADDYPAFASGTMNLDLIMCRNVTIYFSQETTRQIAVRFHTALNENGWLIVGHSEPNLTTYQGFVPRNFTNTVLYQKVSQSEGQTIETSLLATKPLTLAALETKPLTPHPLLAVKPILEAPVTDILIPTQQEQTAWQKAKQLANREQWQEALTMLAQAEINHKFHPEVHYLRAIIQLQINDTDGAFISLRQAIYCDPNFVLAYYTLGELYEREKNYKSALHQWRIARQLIARLDPQSPLQPEDELTAEMLSGLLELALIRLTEIPNANL